MSNPNYPKAKAEDYLLANGGIPILSKKKKHRFQNGRAATGKAVAVELTKFSGDNSLIGQAEIGSGVLVRVQVYSVAKPGMIKQGERKFYRADSGASVAKWVEAVGGALAEECCEKYADTFDPSDYAKAALEALRKSMRELDSGDRLTRQEVKA